MIPPAAKSVRLAIAQVAQARADSRHALSLYHSALVEAVETGARYTDLGAVLDAQPEHLANTVRLHREGRCSCGGGDGL